MTAPVSSWVTRWAHLVPVGGNVLDVGAGSGRHSAFFAGRGHPVTALDRDASSLAAVSLFARTLVADLEQAPWPLPGESFDAVVVTNYLWRPLFPSLLEALAPGGVLLCETFAAGNETVGRPSRPDFLLARGELLQLAQGLRIVAFEDGFLTQPERFVQRIAAVREHPAGRPQRFGLEPSASAGRSLESLGSEDHE